MLVWFSMKASVADIQIYVFLEHFSNSSTSEDNVDINVYWIIYSLLQTLRIYEPFHAKTYNFDWRHNLVKRRHNFAGKFS